MTNQSHETNPETEGKQNETVTGQTIHFYPWLNYAVQRILDSSWKNPKLTVLFNLCPKWDQT